jgi:hypothetical protein
MVFESGSFNLHAALSEHFIRMESKQLSHGVFPNFHTEEILEGQLELSLKHIVIREALRYHKPEMGKQFEKFLSQLTVLNHLFECKFFALFFGFYSVDESTALLHEVDLEFVTY